MSRPVRLIGYAIPTAHGRVYCLSISKPLRYYAYHIISKWKDIVINKNHLFTSHWSLFSLLIPFEKPPVRFMTRLVRTYYHTSGDFPELSAYYSLTPVALISGKVFYMTLLVGCAIMSSGKWRWQDSNLHTRIISSATRLKMWLTSFVHVSITALWRLALVFIVPCVTLSSSNLQRLTRIPVDCF